MGEEMQDKDFLAVVVNGSNEPEVIAANVKDCNDFAALNLHRISVRESFSGLDEVFPRGGQCESRPIVQGSGGFRKVLGIFSQGGPFNQSHC
jgi:hypothetical protein